MDANDSMEYLDEEITYQSAAVASGSLDMETDDDFVSITKTMKTETVEEKLHQKRTVKVMLAFYWEFQWKNKNGRVNLRKYRTTRPTWPTVRLQLLDTQAHRK